MPVPRRRRKAKDAAEPSEAEVTQDQAAEDEADDAKPKRRSRRKSAKKDDAVAASEEATDAKADDETPRAEAEAAEPK